MNLNRTFRLEVKIISLKQFGAYSSWKLTGKSSKTEMSRVKLEIFPLKSCSENSKGRYCSVPSKVEEARREDR